MGIKHGRHSRIMRILRNRIVRGVYEKKLPGGRDLAKEFGTDPRTVYIALAQLAAIGLVRPSERQGTYVTSLAGRPKAAAVLYARLVLGTPFELGGMSFWASLVIYGFQDAARRHNVNMVLEFTDSIDAEVGKALAEADVPGCVGTCLLLSMPVQIKHALRLAEASGPVVLVDWELEEPVIPCVEFDNLDAGRRAAEHLVNLGHRRIAFLNQPQPRPPMRARQKGAQGFMDSVGRRLSICLADRGGAFPVFDGLLRSPDRPTAVIAAHGQLADYFMVVAAGQSVRVPQDLSVLAFGETRFSRLSPVTLVAMDEEALGRRALEALLDEHLWENPRRVLLPVKLADFGTTAAPHA